ncbi:MAG: hypothetical protein FIB04_12490 [Gammaproteobacteria bacterium]|nr:hypothetical protein [Gammaproteobacteria bacterium]
MSQDRRVAQFTPGTGRPRPELETASTRYRSVWEAHRQALSIGQQIESHHAALAALVLHEPARSRADVGHHEEAVRDYKNELRRIRLVLDTLDARLAELLNSLERLPD